MGIGRISYGHLLEVVIKPASDEQKITIGTAMVCTMRPGSMGVRFREFEGQEKTRLNRVALSLLVGQNIHSNGYRDRPQDSASRR